VSGFGSDEQIEGLDPGTGSQKFLDEHFAQESRGARYEHAPIAVKLTDGRFLHFDSLVYGYYVEV